MKPLFGLFAIVVPKRCDREQQPCIRQKVVTVVGREAQFLNACLAVGLSSRGAQEPAHRRGLEAQKIVLQSNGDVAVVVCRVSGKQFVGFHTRLFYFGQRGEAALLDQCLIVGMKAETQRGCEHGVGIGRVMVKTNLGQLLSFQDIGFEASLDCRVRCKRTVRGEKVLIVEREIGTQDVEPLKLGEQPCRGV